MASTSTITRVRRSGRVRAFTGPRLRPLVRRGRAARGRPGGVVAPSLERPLELVGTCRARRVDEAASARTPVSRTAAPTPAPAPSTRPARRESGVHLTERGMLAVLVVFGGLVAAAAAMIVVSFFQVSNAPLSSQHDAAGAAQAAAAGQASGPTGS